MCITTKCVQKCIFFKICNKFEPLISQGSARTYLRRDGKYYVILLEISSSFQQWKNFENRLRFDKVIAKSLLASFLEHSVYVPLYPVHRIQHM